MNLLHLDEQDRPDLSTRERVAGSIEVQCPVCGNWRAGFLLEPFGEEAAQRFGQAWGCDIERSTLNREAAFHAEAANPAELVLTAQQSFRLLTAAEQSRLLTSAEPALLQLVLAALAFDRVIIGSTQHAQAVALMTGLGILDNADRAARIRAGLPPL